MPVRKSVLLITVDQWRGDCLSFRGHPCVETPNFDRLAADGTAFTQHYGQCSPCGPARTSLLTGLYMMNHRSTHNGTPLESRHTNIALETRKAGYDPSLIGYTDTSLDPRGRAPDDPALFTYESPLPGMRVYCDLSEPYQPWLDSLAAKGYRRPEHFLDIFQPAGTEQGPDGRLRAYPCYSAEDSDSSFVAERTIDFLKENQDKPFFLHSVFFRPHPPMIAPRPFNRIYSARDVPEPIRLESYEQESAIHPYIAYETSQSLARKHYGHSEPYDNSEEGLRDLRAVYYGMITEVDGQIGRIIDALKALKLYDDTLIILTSDHGEMLGDHWMFNKNGFHDQSYHIPLIIRCPDRTTRGRQIHAFTESVDIMPTILDWLGLEIPISCDGHSLLPFLKGETQPGWRSEAHWEFDFGDPVGEVAERSLELAPGNTSLCVIRGRDFKYVHFSALPPLFYDLQNDPGQLVNRAQDPDYAGLVLQYAQKMLDWRMRYADRALTNLYLDQRGVTTRDFRANIT